MDRPKKPEWDDEKYKTDSDAFGYQDEIDEYCDRMERYADWIEAKNAGQQDNLSILMNANSQLKARCERLASMLEWWLGWAEGCSAWDKVERNSATYGMMLKAQEALSGKSQLAPMTMIDWVNKQADHFDAALADKDRA